MATRASPKAGRKKVRCPKCTALFAEPIKTEFECPICECRLSVKGANGRTESPSQQAREGDSQYNLDSLGNDQPNKMPSLMDLVKKDGNISTQEGKSTDLEQHSAVFHGQAYKKGEQQPIKEHFQNLGNGNTDGQALVDSCTIDGMHGRNGMLGPFPLLSKPGILMEKKERGGPPLPLPLPPVSGVADKEAAVLSITGQHTSVGESQENSAIERDESREEGIEGQDCVVNSSVSSNRHLQAQMFRTTRCEFSFKYSLADASSSQPDGVFRRKGTSPDTKIALSEVTMPNVDASDMPLHTPLRVRISKSHEESSDLSEHGRESFGSETDSDGTSGSDFDFPAPWAEGPQDLVPPAPFKGNESFHPNLENGVSGTPHQLEMRDVDETLDHEGLTESGKHTKVHNTDLSSQVEKAERKVQSEEHHARLLQPDEKRHALSDRSESAIRGLKSLTSHYQSMDVDDLASYISTSTQLGAVGNDEDCTQKLNGSRLQEGSVGKEEQEVGFKGEFGQDKLRDEEPLQREVAYEPMGVLRTFENEQVMTKESDSATQENITTRFANLSSSAMLPSQEYLMSKQSAPKLNHVESGDVRCSILNKGALQIMKISKKDEHPMIEGISSSMHQIEQSNGVADVMDGRTPTLPVVSHMVDTEIEQDLYKPPLAHESDKNDLYPAESSRSALSVEEEESSMSAFSDDSASVRKHYQSTQKSLHGKKVHRNVGSQVTRSDHGEEQVMLRRALGASREASLQIPPEHGDWEGGHIDAMEGWSSRTDLHGKAGSYSQLGGFPPVNSHPYAFANHSYRFQAPDTTNEIPPYQLPAQSLIHPAAAFQNHGLSHCGYHPVPTVCTLCSYHQHPHLPPQHIPYCGACCSPSSMSAGHTPGLVEHWNCHQAKVGSASGSLVDYPQAYSPANQIQSYDFPNAKSRSQASSAKKYPPYPQICSAPYAACKGCARVLLVPVNLPLNEGMIQKLRCGSCGKVTKFSTRGVMSSTLSPRLDAMGGVANMLPQTGPYDTHNKRLPISSATEIIKSSYKHDMIQRDPLLRDSNELSPESRSPKQNTREDDFCRVQPRGQVMVASTDAYVRHASGMGGVMSPRNSALRSTDSVGFERSNVNPAASYHLPVDEKEEGLDFGAPRISDGDSLDHGESRMRSPEYNQAGQETLHVDVPRGVALRAQVLDGSVDGGTAAASEKQSGPPLLVLFNQESTRFRLNVEPRVPFEGSKVSLWSPASDSAVYANSLHKRHQNREQGNPRSPGSPGHHFVSKGPKYIAGLLRRSLRDFNKG